jgi:outer membrane receptor protein involved in Fe transport
LNVLFFDLGQPPATSGEIRIQHRGEGESCAMFLATQRSVVCALCVVWLSLLLEPLNLRAEETAPTDEVETTDVAADPKRQRDDLDDDPVEEPDSKEPQRIAHRQPTADGTAPSTEPTLPEVTVSPDQIAPQTPNFTNTPPSPLTPNLFGGSASSYPSLSDVQFNGGGGAFGGLLGTQRGTRSTFDSPQFGEVLNREMIAEKSASDMAQTLQYEVGVLMQQTARGQASPFIRGLTGQQILVLIDGVRMNNSTYRAGPNQYFDLVDPGQVDRIEVIRGAQSVLWGSDAIGGVINIITRSANPNAGNYAQPGFREYFSTADLASYTRANGEAWSNGLGVFGGASYMNVNDLDRGGGLGRQPFTDYSQYAGDVKFNWQPDPDQLLTVALQHFEQNDLPRSDRFLPFVAQGFPPNNVPRPTYFDPQQRDLAYVRWEGLSDNALFDAFGHNVSYSRNREATSDLRPTGAPPQFPRLELSEFDVNTVGATFNFSRDLDFLGALTYGADYYYDDISSFRHRVQGSGAFNQNPQFPDGSRYDRAGVYLCWSVDLTQNLSAVSGVRYENVNAAGTINQFSGPRTPFDLSYQGWIPSVGLVYSLSENFNMVGGMYEGFRAPNLDDLAADNPVLQGSQDLPSLNVQPERARTYEFGFKFDGPQARWQVVQFWNDLRDNILRQAVGANGQPVPNSSFNGIPIPGSSNFIRSNFDSYIYGTEFNGEYLLSSGWSLYGNAWYTFGKDRERQEPLSRIPPLQGVAGFRWREDLGRDWFEVFTWMVDRQDRYAVQNNGDARFPVGGNAGFATLNLRAGRSFGRFDNHRFSLSLLNITDKYYRVLGSGVDGSGVNAIFGYDLNY